MLNNVLYYPNINDEAIHRLSESQPCPAVVLFTHDNSDVDLLVTDNDGRHHMRHYVPVGPCRSEDYCVNALPA